MVKTMVRSFYAISLGIFFCLFCLGSKGAFSQDFQIGSPTVINYSSVEFKASPENFCVVQNSFGMIYFGNHGRVLEFDGTTWRHIPVKADMPILALASDSTGLIYVSAGNEFGVLLPNFNGKLKYFSISNLLNISDEFVERIGNTFVTNDAVYFQTANNLYKFSYPLINQTVQALLANKKINEKPIVYKAETQFTNSYMLDGDKVFVHQKDLGLMLLVDGKFDNLVKGGKFVDRKTIAILPFKPKQIVVCTEKGIFYYTWGKGFGTFSSETQNFYDEIEILNAIALPDAYVFSTLNRGTFVIEKNSETKKRKIVEQYDKRAGLTTEQTTMIYNNQQVDNRMLWLTTSYGISKTKINSPIRKINEAQDVKDVILDMKNFDNRLYVRTLGEIYYLKDTTDKYQFFNVENVVSNNDWAITPIEVEVQVPVEENFLKKMNKRRKPKFETKLEIQNRVFVATDEGLYQVNNNVANYLKYSYISTNSHTLVSSSKTYKPEYNINKIAHSQWVKSRMFLGLENGFAVVSQQNGKWIDEGMVEGVKEAISGVAEDANGDIWLSTTNKGLYQLILPSEKNIEFVEKIIKATKTVNADTIRYLLFPKKVEVKTFGTQNGLPKMLPNGVFYSKTLVNEPCKGMLFLTTEGIFMYNKADGKFVKDNTFPLPKNDTEVKVLSITEDKKGNFWLRTQDEFQTWIVSFERGKSGKFEKYSKGFKLLPQMTVQSIFPDTAGVVWISGTDGLYSYDTQYERIIKNPFYAFVRKVTIGHDSVLFWGSALNSEFAMSYNSPPKFTLNYRENNLRFEFSAPFFEDEKSTVYSYYLEGFDTQWSDWSKETRKEYTNLPQKNYVFRVKAKNIYDEESVEGTFAFVIPVPWHSTWWFQTLEVVFFLLLILISVILNRSSKSSRATQILTMIAVVTIFKLLGNLFLAPMIELFSDGISFVKLLLDIILGAAILPLWSWTMRLIQGKQKEQS